MAKKKLINWNNLAYTEAKKIDKEKVVVFVSGAIEPHGEHLPLGSDFFCPKVVAQEVCRRTGSIYGEEIPYGLSMAWNEAPGLVTIRAETLASLIEDLINSFYSQGFRRFLVIHGHGDNPIGIDLAFYHLIPEKRDIILKQVNWCHKDFTAVSKKLKYEVYHADKGETEMVMIYDPSLVKMKKAKDFKDYKKRLSTGWQADLMKVLPFTVGGEPSKANKRDAKLLFENVVVEICKVVRKLEKRK